MTANLRLLLEPDSPKKPFRLGQPSSKRAGSWSFWRFSKLCELDAGIPNIANGRTQSDLRELHRDDCRMNWANISQKPIV